MAFGMLGQEFEEHSADGAIREIRHRATRDNDPGVPIVEAGVDPSQHFDALLNASFDGFAVVDATGKILKVNQAYTRITGIPKDKIVGRTIRELLNRGVLKQVVTIEVMKHGIPITMMLDYPSGKTALATGTPVFDSKGTLSLIIINFRDITELNKLRERLGQTRAPGDAGKSIFLSQELADLPTFNLVIHGEVMKWCLALALKAAKYNSPVLLSGESGVGKGRFARLIHDASPRRDAPFIHLNCGAIPENLVESELFGYAQGAFTGALASGKAGQFELAHKGTLFLDEISELDPNLQVKLLNVIDDNEVRRLGGRQSVAIDVRLIAATNRELNSMVRNGTFREDLYFRLNVLPIKIPPLRERAEEIPVLIGSLLETLFKKCGHRKRLAPEVIQALIEYDYPGNVRELENILERLVLLSDGDIIEQRSLGLCGFEKTESSRAPNQTADITRGLRAAVESCEAAILQETLERHSTLIEAARALRISIPTLWRKLRKHHIQIAKAVQRRR